MNKITIIGSGNIGTQIAFLCMSQNLANITLLDINENLAKGKALDISQSKSIFNSNINIEGTSNYEKTKNSNITIITAGISRKPGMTREDLIQTNKNILKNIIPNIEKYSPNTIIIVVSNPIDSMVYLTYKLCQKIPKEKIIGMAGILDSSRFKHFISKKLNISPNQIQTHVLGSHGNLMVPIISQTTINNKNINEYLTENEINLMIEKTKNGGSQIIEYLKTQSAFITPATATYQIIKSIIKNEKLTLDTHTLLNGEYGFKNIFFSTPTIIGKNGIEKIVELKITSKEKKELELAANHIQKLNQTL